MSNTPYRKNHDLFWSFPHLFETDHIFECLPKCMEHSGLTVCEDKDYVIVEAALPGLSAKEIEVTFEKGILRIQGHKEEKEEDEKRNYYRRAAQSYSYSVDIPQDVDEKVDPSAEYRDGMMSIKIKKTEKKATRPIKIQIT